MGRSSRRAWLRMIVAGAAFVAVPSAQGSEGEDPTEAEALDSPPTCIPADRCCQICSAGKACGNSCIQARKTCHKGRGCACNAGQVCGAEETP